MAYARTPVDVERGGLCRCGSPILNDLSSLKSFSLKKSFHILKIIIPFP